MRIVIFTVDDVDFVPKILDPLLDRYKDSIIHIYVSDSFPGPLAIIKNNLFFFIKNYYPFCIRISDLFNFALGIIKNKFGKEHANIYKYLEHKGATATKIESIRTNLFLKELKDLNPDVCVFAPFDKIACPNFLTIPKYGSLNVHLGKLPSYRGGLSAFWILRYGDKEAGASVHKVDTGIDTGELLEEVRLPVNTNSMKILMDETIEKTAPAIIKAVEKLTSDNCNAIDISERESNYYYMPTAKDFSEFYKRGCRLI